MNLFVVSACGRLQPVAERFFQQFERLLLVRADLRSYRGLGALGVNILEIT